jgi:acyl-ACP thioesterase
MRYSGGMSLLRIGDHGGVLAATTLAPAAEGRRFQASRPVRLADAGPSGRLRLDALARHLQDVASDDSADAGWEDGRLTWVVRRAAVATAGWPRYRERLAYTTFCSGVGPHWAERRTTGRGAGGAEVEAAVLWICVDAATGRLAPLSEGFHRTWGSTAGGRTVSARLLHPPAPGDGTAPSRPWQVRATDLDVLGHVNNAVHWAAVEDELARALPGRVPVAAECEYRLPVGIDDPLTLVSRPDEADGTALRVWLVGRRGVHASALVRTAPRR